MSRRAASRATIAIALAAVCIHTPAQYEGSDEDTSPPPPPAIAAAYPIVSIGLGDDAADIGFEVDGQAGQIVVSARGTSAAGAFASASGVIVQRDQAVSHIHVNSNGT